MATTVRAMLNTDRISVSGYYPLVIRVICNRRKSLIYSPYKLRKEDFDPHSERAVWRRGVADGVSKKQVEEINRYLAEQMLEIERLLDRLERLNGGVYTVENILAGYRNLSCDRYLFSYMEKEIETKRGAGRDGTASLYESTRNSLLRFTGPRKIAFRDITYKFISDYIDHLQARGVSRNTINMYLRNLRSVYNKARKEGLTPLKASPFMDIKMNGLPTVKRALPKETIRQIAHLDLSHDPGLECVRDLFMFSFYTRGMSLVDILFLKHSDIASGVVYYVRNKTKQNLQVAVTAPLQTLIDKYRSDSPFVLPYLKPDNPEPLYRQYRKALSTINLKLKKIGEMIDLETPLTTYVARHSWASVAKTEGAPIAAISEGLGHTTEKTTQIYLRAFDRSVIDQVNEMVVTLL